VIILYITATIIVIIICKERRNDIGCSTNGNGFGVFTGRTDDERKSKKEDLRERSSYLFDFYSRYLTYLCIAKHSCAVYTYEEEEGPRTRGSYSILDLFIAYNVMSWLVF